MIVIHHASITAISYFFFLIVNERSTLTESPSLSARDSRSLVTSFISTSCSSGISILILGPLSLPKRSSISSSKAGDLVPCLCRPLDIVASSIVGSKASFFLLMKSSS
eukprot:TRINITY_DN23661_c0_g4_i1.p2 TRINITY_DN23661_c0_g4~~TRINITY_DN23661_c0_g4_i1.p2  ORF type:complete len:108 (+),score=0.30 TRINITY_DN23661_c0_g4_i1:626-949(+)